MALLDEAIEASGGMARWHRFTRFTLQLSIDGALFSQAGRAGTLNDIVAEGLTSSQSVRIIGFADFSKSGHYQPDRVTVESATGKLLGAWPHPLQTLQNHDRIALSDDLHLVFVCGFSIWNYLTTPFLLARPDVLVEELPSQPHGSEVWRRLRATFPPTIITHSRQQIFYFDSKGLQRRADHELLGRAAAQFSWAHQAFDGIVVPTLRRSLAIEADGTVTPKPPLLDVEIFDASFE